MPTPARTARISTVIEQRQQGVVVLEDIHDPHNGQAVLRCCDAFGIHNVWFVFEKQPSYNPRKIGKATSSTANKWLSYRSFRSTSECLDALEAAQYQSVGTLLSETAQPISQVDLTTTPQIALWFGNEHTGLSETARARIGTHLIIPMQGMVESLNISVSAGVVLYELSRQRNAAGLENFLLPATEKQALRDDLRER